MYHPSSAPEKIPPPAPSGVALVGGGYPDNQNFIKPTVFKVHSQNFIFVVIYYPLFNPEQITPIRPPGVALGGGWFFPCV